MEWTGLNELRESFLTFFESKEHLRLPSYSLVPDGDKSLLLINSGMAPMKKFFTREVTPPRYRVTTCQKCIRTPDIDNVGHTARHGTYFEMLGNFSFGDYFKEDAIPWAWEYFTEVLKIPADKLYCSVYEDDDEAYEIWTKKIGVPEDHMVRLGKEDNFWEHGEGPCGPCSEIYFDRGEKYGCGKPTCAPGCDCDRYMEVWNLVFSQFNNDGNDNYTPLEHKNIDTGMGLERLACVMQGVDNLFEVDTVQNIMKTVSDLSGVKYHEDEKNDISLRVITDHARSMTFMIGDGIKPSNSGAGYVLRRLMRRAMRQGRSLGIEGPFLTNVAEMVIHENANAYPNLVEKHDYIMSIISGEEATFNKTLDTGSEQLEKMIAAANGKELPAEDAFKLSDTFGFPIELTREICEERGLTVDEDKFREYVAEARARAKADAASKDVAEAWKGKGDATKDVPATEFLGYTDFDTTAKVLAIVKEGDLADSAETGEDAVLVVDRTTFYARSGGQIGDAGVIECGGFTFEVDDTVKTENGVYLHSGTVTAGIAKTGETVDVKIDADRRRSIMRNHTAAHLLQAALREVLGTHVEQAGQQITAETARFDFNHPAAMTGEELKAVEDRVNEVILENIPVETKVLSIEDAKKLGAMMLFGEKYGDVVRVVCVEEFSKEFCGGTHVASTAQLGLFKIVSESSVAAGVRRIEGVTGTNLLKYIDQKNTLIANAAAAMKANVNEIDHKAAQLAADLKASERKVAELNKELAAISAKDMMGDAVDLGAVKLICSKTEGVNGGELRNMADSAAAEGADLVVVLASVAGPKVSFACACGADAVKAGANAGNIVREVAKIAGGSGGGKPDSAMAGGKDAAKVDDALAAAAEIVKGMLK